MFNDFNEALLKNEESKSEVLRRFIREYIKKNKQAFEGSTVQNLTPKHFKIFPKGINQSSIKN